MVLNALKNFDFVRCDIENAKALKKVFAKYRFDAVVNLAARAGVRYSMDNPYVYSTTNFSGVLNLLELCRYQKIKKFVLASTSSLYAGQKMPFSEKAEVNTPISPYAATKKAAEVMAYTYHFLYGIDVSVLRYFTVYGPAGRPDMSYLKFICYIDRNQPIPLFGDGLQSRDFTYISDIASGTVKALKPVGYEVINLGGNRPYRLEEMIHLIEQGLGKRAKYKYMAMPKVDMPATWADIRKASRVLGWKPQVDLKEGIHLTVQWYLANKQFVQSLYV